MRCVRLAIITVSLVAGCALSQTKSSFAELEDEFIYTTLSFSPVAATSAGYHRTTE
jgi:hypothetical protein